MSASDSPLGTQRPLPTDAERATALAARLHEIGVDVRVDAVGGAAVLTPVDPSAVIDWRGGRAAVVALARHLGFSRVALEIGGNSEST